MLRFASHDIRISTQLIGSFHVENILCATAVLIAMKLPIDFIETSLQSLRPLSGRMEPISNTA
jgi:UDP-N-acetylmuramyl tripeptide synthase